METIVRIILKLLLALCVPRKRVETQHVAVRAMEQTDKMDLSVHLIQIPLRQRQEPAVVAQINVKLLLDNQSTLPLLKTIRDS